MPDFRPLVCASRAPAFIALLLLARRCTTRSVAHRSRTPRPPPRAQPGPPPPVAGVPSTAGVSPSRRGAAEPDWRPRLHGQARRHAVPDRARARARLSRARRVEQHREREPDSRRTGAAADARRAKPRPAGAGRRHDRAAAHRAAGRRVASRRAGAPSPASHPHAAGSRATPRRQVVAEGDEGAVLAEQALRDGEAAREPAQSHASPATPPRRRLAASPLATPAPASAVRTAPPVVATRAAHAAARAERRRRRSRLGMAGEGQGRRPASRTPRTSRASTSRARAGQPVVASAGGHASSTRAAGLRGYGKLIIIKHNKTYLSAYAHNRDILVKEGEQVTQGPEDRRDGQHRRRPGEAALRDPPARASRWIRSKFLPPARSVCRPAPSPRRRAARRCRQHFDRALERRDQRRRSPAADPAVAQLRERFADRGERDRELRPARARARAERERALVRLARQARAREPHAHVVPQPAARSPGGGASQPGEDDAHHSDAASAAMLAICHSSPGSTSSVRSSSAGGRG